MPQVRIVAKNFMDMVAALPAMKLDKLYESTFICEAVLRSLPPLAKKYILQMLFIDSPIAAKSMEDWVLPDGFSKHKVAIDRLLQLRLFVEVTDRKKETSYRLNPIFQSNMQKCLVYGGTLPREPMPTSATGRLPSLEDLDSYALNQWEDFLLQLINSAQVDRPTNFSPSIMRVFQRGLLSSRENEAPRLTENGFQFLLMDTNAQLWYMIREYILSSEDRGVDPTDLISFLLELSFHSMGEGFVVVETNFRMYAYSTSKLHCEILRLFSRIEYQLPNLIVGSITKESLYNAFENGITAEQIISFLQQNAHPRVAEKVPTVPENVTDQVRLWETDRNRVEMTPSHLYEDFPSREVFEAACDFAREYSGLLWEDSKKMRLIVRGDLHQHMRDFLRRQK